MKHGLFPCTGGHSRDGGSGVPRNKFATSYAAKLWRKPGCWNRCARRPCSLNTAVIAVGVDGEGHRGVLGLAVGPAGTEVFWTQFPRDLTCRGQVGTLSATVFSGGVAALRLLAEELL